MTDDLQRLAKEFPGWFRFQWGGDYDEYRDLSSSWPEFYIKAEGYDWEIEYPETPTKLDTAILHAALVELVESAGLVLVQSPLNERWWALWMRTERGLSGPLVNVENNGEQPTPLAAVLAAAPEIKRRLEEVTT